MNQEYMQAFAVTKGTCSQDLQRLLDFLEGYCEQHAVVSVYGRGKSKSIVSAEFIKVCQKQGQNPQKEILFLLLFTKEREHRSITIN